MNDLSYMPVPKSGPPTFAQYHGYTPGAPQSYADYHGLNQEEFMNGMPGDFATLMQASFAPGTLQGNTSPAGSFIKSGIPSAAKSMLWNQVNRAGNITSATGSLIGGAAQMYSDKISPWLKGAADVGKFLWEGPEQFNAPDVSSARAVTPPANVNAAISNTTPAQSAPVPTPTAMPVPNRNFVPGAFSPEPATDSISLPPAGSGITNMDSAHENWGSIVDPRETLMEQLDPEYLQVRKDQQNREWSADYEVSKAQEKFDAANRRAEWIAKTFADHPTGQARMVQAMTAVQNAHENLKMATQGRGAAMALTAQEQQARADRQAKTEEFANAIKVAQIKAGEGDGQDLAQYHAMAEKALIAAGVEAKKAKDVAPLIIQQTANGINFSPEMMKTILGLDDEDSIAAANATANLFNTMSGGNEDFEKYRNAFMKAYAPGLKDILKRLDAIEAGG